MLEVYLRKPYADGAMGPDSFNCWGLVRAVRHDIYGLPLLPEYGRKISPSSESQSDYLACSGLMRECGPIVGAIAAAFRGLICVHVGLVVEYNSRLSILETNSNTGARITKIKDFERRYSKVIYYHDSDLSEQARR